MSFLIRGVGFGRAAAVLLVVAAPLASGAATTTTAAAAATSPARGHGVVGEDPAHAFDATVQRYLSQSGAATWSAHVEVAGLGQVSDIRGATQLPPASTQKLFTTARLLMGRGPSALVTSVMSTARPSSGVVRGDLLVVAASDPALTSRDLAAMAQSVRRNGVRQVTGRLVLVIGAATTNATRSGWRPQAVPADVPPLSALSVDRDSKQTSAAYRSHPTSANLATFRKALSAAGVSIVGRSVTVHSTPEARVTVLASHTSISLAWIVNDALTNSDNFEAEELLNVVGGTRAVDALRASVGASGSETDGSGVSYADRETAVGEVALLDMLQAHGYGPRSRAALPAACKIGTLKTEMCGTLAAGQVWAKTGTLAHDKVLAGWTTDALGRLVTFALFCHAVANTRTAFRQIENVVIALRNSRL